MHDYALYIGRFQPFHNGHLASIRYGLNLAKKVVIALGGYHLAPSPVDPWSAKERKKMILSSLDLLERKRIKFIYVRDRLYDEASWKENLVNEFLLATKNHANVVIIGHMRDHTSYYLKIFPQWPFMETGNFSDFNGTEIRRNYFLEKKLSREQLPSPVFDFLNRFQKAKKFKLLRAEYERYKMKEKSHVDGMLSHLPQEKKMILRYGNYILLKKYKQKFAHFLYEIPKTDEIHSLRYKKYFVSEKSFYLQKYDGPHKKGRCVSYYYIPAHVKFHIKKFPKSRYQWMIIDDLYVNEESMFADSYQIIHSFVLHRPCC